MQVDIKTDELNECSCGHKPDHYTIGYGRTPYNLQCKCKKRIPEDISGGPQNVIEAWNKICKL